MAEKEYIEREATIEFVKQNTPHFDGQTTMECVERSIRYAPTADVAEVKRAEWKVETYKISDAKFIKCSNCNSVIDSNFTHIDENEFDYCPYCGAKMDGKENGNAKLS